MSEIFKDWAWMEPGSPGLKDWAWMEPGSPGLVEPGSPGLVEILYKPGVCVGFIDMKELPPPATDKDWNLAALQTLAGRGGDFFKGLSRYRMVGRNQTKARIDFHFSWIPRPEAGLKKWLNGYLAGMIREGTLPEGWKCWAEGADHFGCPRYGNERFWAGQTPNDPGYIADRRLWDCAYRRGAPS